MVSPEGITRIILLVLDGLRPDAITRSSMPTLASVAERGAGTMTGVTVEPSLTAAALASLLTGVPPEVHGIRHERRLIPRAGQRLRPLPGVLRDHGYRMHGFMAALPPGFGMIGSRLAARLGASATFAGADAASILEHALPTLRRCQRGVTFMHWPDADLAGHDHGWMSAAYHRAATRLDHSLEQLLNVTQALTEPGTVVIACADHGGGGEATDNHNSNHPLDVTIPIVLAGGQVVRTALPPGSTLLDVAATVPWALGIQPPIEWMGSPLYEAFTPVLQHSWARLGQGAAA